MQNQRQHDHSHDHPAAPMVDEITDFEILEIAVRELAIEKGLFTAEDHRKFSEWAESIGPAGGSRLAAKAWTDPAFMARCHHRLQGDRHRLGRAYRLWLHKRLHASGRARRYAHLASCDHVHSLLVLSTAVARPLALLVPFAELSSQDSPLATPGPGGVRIGSPSRGRGAGRGLQPEMPLYGPPGAARRHRALDGGAAGRNRDARLHDRRCPAAARPQGGRCSAGPQGRPAGPR